MLKMHLFAILIIIAFALIFSVFVDQPDQSGNADNRTNCKN